MKRIILASGSPRRLELLQGLLTDFDVVPSNYDEQLDESRDVKEVAEELSLGKALDVAKLYPDAFVIGSDTIVSLGNRQLGKSKSLDEARQALTDLAGKDSGVTTGVALVNLSLGIQDVKSDTVEVYFKADSDEITVLREEYLASGGWRGMAGAYGIQNGAAVLIDHIEGNYNSIVGLPTELLRIMLTEAGVQTK
jgi:septum formation protein